MLFREAQPALPLAAVEEAPEPVRDAVEAVHRLLAVPRLAKLGKLANFCKFLAGSFSAVSKRNFARKYAFDSFFKLYKICILLHRCNLKIFAKNRFENLQFL